MFFVGPHALCLWQWVISKRFDLITFIIIIFFNFQNHYFILLLLFFLKCNNNSSLYFKKNFENWIATTFQVIHTLKLDKSEKNWSNFIVVVCIFRLEQGQSKHNST